jgi:hypothetical protein
MKPQNFVSKGLLRSMTGFLADLSVDSGKNLPTTDTFMGSFQSPKYPKNTDVKHIRPSIADRIDIALNQFPGRTALLFLALAALVVSIANLV